MGRKKKTPNEEKHKALLEDFEESKRKHLEKLGTKLLKQDEIAQKLKEKKIDDKFLDLF